MDPFWWIDSAAVSHELDSRVNGAQGEASAFVDYSRHNPCSAAMAIEVKARLAIGMGCAKLDAHQRTAGVQMGAAFRRQRS